MKDILKFLKRFGFTLTGAVLLLTILVPVALAQTPEVEKAKRLLEHDQGKKAVEVMEQAVKTTPSTITWFYLGYVQLKTGSIPAAIQSFDKGIALNEKDGLNYAGKGYAKLKENAASEEAKQLLDKALTISKSKDEDVLKVVAEAYLTNSKRAVEAQQLLEKAKSQDGNDPEIYILLGDAFLAQNNGGSAVSSYERAAKLAPQLGTPHYKIGMVYQRSKNNSVAIESLNAAVKADSEYTMAYKELGELYYQTKEADKAVAAYQKYLSLTEDPKPGRMQYAFILLMAKKYAEANTIFEELVQNKDVAPIALRYYAFSLNESGNLQKSATILEQYIQRVPAEQVEAGDYSLYAKLLLKQSPNDSLVVNKAIENLQKSVAKDSTQTDVLQLLGETTFKTQRYVESAKAYEGLSKARKKPYPQDYYMLGRAYFYSKDFNKADTVFRKLIELQPNIPAGYLWEARTQSSLDPESEAGLAKPFYEQLIEKYAATPEKGKNDLAEAYSYLGYYYFIKEDYATSKPFWQKVLAIDPTNSKAKKAVEVIEQGTKKQGTKQQ